MEEMQEGVSYLSYFVLGAINISLVSNALVAATKMFLDKYVGLYEEILTYPVSRQSILLGKLLFNLILSVLQSLIMLFFVQLILNDWSLSLPKLASLIVVIMIGSSAWFYLLMILSMKLKTQDNFNTMYYLVMTPIIFTSSIYYPTENMNIVLRIISELNPLTWFTDIGRYLYLDMESDFLGYKFINVIKLVKSITPISGFCSFRTAFLFA